MDGRPRFAIWMLCVGSLLARSSAGSSVVVPDQFSTIQAAIDSGADSVLVRPAVYDESLAIDRGIVVLGLLDPAHPDQLPTVSGLCVTIVGDRKHEIVDTFRMLHFLGTVGISVADNGVRLNFHSCHLDSGLDEGGSSTNKAFLTLSGCIVHGPLNASLGSVWFDDNKFFGGIRIYCEGSVNIRSNDIHGPAPYGLDIVGANLESDYISDNVIAGVGTGIHVMNREHPFIERNRVTDCSNDGILVDYYINELTVMGNIVQRCGGSGIRFPSSSWLEENTVEDCGLDGISGYQGTFRSNQVRRVGGAGIVVYRVEGEFTGNSVIDARGVGISAGTAIFTSNVVGRCGSHGIESTGGSFHNNTIYRCGGSGIRMWSGEFRNNVVYQNAEHAVDVVDAAHGRFFCNDWNGNLLGAVQGDTVGATDIDLDPRFCDVDHDSIGLRPDSPLLATGDCGLIGARGLGCDAPTEILVALFTAESMDQGVRLRWRLGGDELPSNAWIERSDSEPGPWQRIPTERALEADARVDWDRGAQPGHHYWYRLVWDAPGREIQHSSPVAVVTAASHTVFSLRAIWPNPTSGPITMEYSLPRSTKIELAVLDLMGREVARVASGVQASGVHVSRWLGDVQSGPARPGIYFVRLRHPDGQESRRILLRR